MSCYRPVNVPGLLVHCVLLTVIGHHKAALGLLSLYLRNVEINFYSILYTYWASDRKKIQKHSKYEICLSCLYSLTRVVNIGLKVTILPALMAGSLSIRFLRMVVEISENTSLSLVNTNTYDFFCSPTVSIFSLRSILELFKDSLRSLSLLHRIDRVLDTLSC